MCAWTHKGKEVLLNKLYKLQMTLIQLQMEFDMYWVSLVWN